MELEFKILFSLLISFVFFFALAYPGAMFAKWGERIFRSYNYFLDFIIAIHMIPIVITALYILWNA